MHLYAHGNQHYNYHHKTHKMLSRNISFSLRYIQGVSRRCLHIQVCEGLTDIVDPPNCSPDLRYTRIPWLQNKNIRSNRNVCRVLQLTIAHCILYSTYSDGSKELCIVLKAL